MSATGDRADLILRGGTVVTVDAEGTVHDAGSVAVRDGVIVEVAPVVSATITAADEVIDTTGAVVMPGFVNAHCHSAFWLARGLEPELPLDEWLPYVFAEGAAIGPEEAAAGSALAYLDMLERGVTTCVDHHYAQRDRTNADAVVEAAVAAGLRVLLAPTASDIGAFSIDERAAVEDHERLAAAVASKGRGRLSLWVALASPMRRETAARCRLLRDLAANDRAGLTYHYAETRAWLSLPAQAGLDSLSEVLDELGLLGESVLVAHGVWFDDDDIAALAASGTAVSHNPVANMYMGDGIAPVVAMRAAGVQVGLGSDAANCNNGCDPFEVMKSAALLQKVAALEPRVLRAPDALALATRGGAAAVGLGDVVGSIEVGKAADLAVVDFDRPHLTPCHDVIANLVYCATGADVETVVVAGDVLVRRGRAVGVDREQVLESARRAAARVAAGARS